MHARQRELLDRWLPGASVVRDPVTTVLELAGQEPIPARALTHQSSATNSGAGFPQPPACPQIRRYTSHNPLTSIDWL